MPENDGRDIAATVIRGVAAGAAMTAKFSPDPLIAGAATGAGAILQLVANLVESIGQNKAEETLRELTKHHAKLITSDDLAAEVARIKHEFGL